MKLHITMFNQTKGQVISEFRKQDIQAVYNGHTRIFHLTPLTSSANEKHRKKV